ncbi:PAS domain-containing protein [Brevundimonas sp.]|uniref:PAS domain-containing protein n=1 Tax=Brevundimonas sp. TaxID=1871086 RepID=UPI003BABF7EB
MLPAKAEAMFHSGTQQLIDAWTALPDARRIPARADFEPLRMGTLVPQLFAVDRQGARLRLAGGWIERLHGGSLGGVDWLTLWREDSRPMVAAAIVQTFREARPVVLAADSERLDGILEIVIAPLRSASDVADRLIGLYQPISAADRSADSVGLLGARLSIGVGAVSRPPLSLAAIDGRRIA